VTLGLTALRATGAVAVLLLLWNPAGSREVPGSGEPLVLLDASLSMAGPPDDRARWRRALDTARALARGGVVWRFGSVVAAFDSGPPADGASRLAPALAAAAARGGVVTVVTDGAVPDWDAIPPDLRRRPRVVLLPGMPFPDAFVAAVTGNRRLSAGDTLLLGVTYGAAGGSMGTAQAGARLDVRLNGRVMTSRSVGLPDSGIATAELSLPAARLPAGWSALEVALVVPGGDPEPRDDARWIVVYVGLQPAAVVLAAPPDWDARFLAQTLADVARVPLRTFVEPAPASGWRDAASLAPVGAALVQRAVDSARLVVLAGDPARVAAVRVPPRAAILAWPMAARDARGGDWYVDPPPGSPVAAALAGVPWDSLPPLIGLGEVALDSLSVPALGARLARRGAAQPVLVLSERGGRREAAMAAQGLWRWRFRGGSAAEAYRALVAATADWLLGAGDAGRARAVPLAHETPQGLPLRWRWVGPGAAGNLVAELQGDAGPRVDTLRFDAGGMAELRLPPGVYRYALRGGGERGLVAVETYSDEWRPATATLGEQAGLPGGGRESRELRDRWWLFVLAIGAFAAEWAWRRRQGLP
jgi:hypothetical protein